MCKSTSIRASIRSKQIRGCRARPVADIKGMLGIDNEEERECFETGMKRLQWDVEDNEMIARQLAQFHVFEHHGLVQ